MLVRKCGTGKAGSLLIVVLIILVSPGCRQAPPWPQQVQQVLNKLQDEHDKSVVLVIDRSKSMIDNQVNTAGRGPMNVMELAIKTADAVADTLRPGDEFTLLTFDSTVDPANPEALAIRGPQDIQRAHDAIQGICTRVGSTINVPHPERRGTNIRVAHHAALEELFRSQRAHRHCILITDGQHDPVPVGAPFHDGYLQYYPWPGVSGRAELPYPNTPQVSAYRKRVQEANSNHIDFMGIGLDINDGRPREGAGNQVPPYLPRTPLEKLLGLPNWAKALFCGLLVVAAVAIRRMAYQPQYVYLKSSMAQAESMFFLKPGGCIDLGSNKLSAYEVNGATEAIARIVLKSFGKLTLSPVPHRLEASIKMNTTEVTRPTKLVSGNRIFFNTRADKSQPTSASDDITVEMFRTPKLKPTI